jgi:hypothetical protein
MSPLCINDVVGESAVYCLHHEDTHIGKCLHDTECYIKNVHSDLHIHDKSGKFEWIQH